MSTLFEHYNINDDDFNGFYGIYWEGQTFTPSVEHTITSVILKLYKAGNPGTLTVSIRATDAGKPTGGDLCSGTTNGNLFTTDTAGAWYEITLGAGYLLSAGVKYAIVVRATSGNSANHIHWRRDTTSPAYGGGVAVYSLNSGVGWYLNSTRDYMFEEWGEAAGWSGKIAGVTNPAKVMGVDIAGIAKVKGVA